MVGGAGMLGCLTGFAGDGGGAWRMTGVFVENGVADGVVILTFTSFAASFLPERKKMASIATIEISVSPMIRIRTSRMKLAFLDPPS